MNITAGASNTEHGEDDVNDTDFNVVAATSAPVESSDDECEEYRFDRSTKISSACCARDVIMSVTY